MKRLNFRTALLGSVLLLPATLPAATLVDFEDLDLSTVSHKEDWRPTNSFSSSGTSFNNVYNSDFASWGGFALSREGNTTLAGFGNQYSSFAGGGSGANGGTVTDTNFVVGYVDPFTPTNPTINFAAGDIPLSLRITNTTYAALSMLNGDQFAKKFGGPSGNDPDYLKLTISGFDVFGNSTGQVNFYLADYTFADNSQDYVVQDWRLVDLSTLGGNTNQLVFSMESTDVAFGFINTPTYFALDNLVVIPEPGAPLLLAAATGLLGMFRRRR